jgi:hypothetical protein
VVLCVLTHRSRVSSTALKKKSDCQKNKEYSEGRGRMQEDHLGDNYNHAGARFCIGLRRSRGGSKKKYSMNMFSAHKESWEFKLRPKEVLYFRYGRPLRWLLWPYEHKMGEGTRW